MDNVQNLNQVSLDPAGTRVADLKTRDQVLPETVMVTLPEVHTSSGAVADSKAPGSSALPLLEPRRTLPRKDKPVPSMGAQQSHTPAGHEVHTTRETARQSLRHDKTTVKDTDVKNIPCPPKLAVVPASEYPESTVSVRSNTSKQPHRSPEAKLPSDLLHRRDFEVRRIRRKYNVKGSVLFSVRWKSTWVPLEAIIEGDDQECSYVEADGDKWYIRKQLESRTRNGLPERKVRWTSTREPLENLANAQEAIKKFEAKWEKSGLGHAQRVQQRTVLTFEESSFPRGVVRPQNDADYASSQRWIARVWPMIRPHRTLDLYPAIYRIQMELSGLKPGAKANHRVKSYRDFMRQPQVRSLQWSEEYIKSGRSFRFSKRKRAALFLQVTGELDTNGTCTRCLGEKLAPFVGCVRTAAGQQSWLGGACANCGTQDSSFCPHHKKGILGRGKSALYDSGAILVHVLIA
jgi:hypothetical protein